MFSFARAATAAVFITLSLSNYPLFGQYTVSTFAGSNIPAQASLLTIPLQPQAVALDKNGVLYVADITSLYKVDASGNLTRVAGNGLAGRTTPDGMPAANNPLGYVNALAIDNTGNIYVAIAAQVRKIDAVTGLLTTVAGTGVYGFTGDGAAATAAEFQTILGLAVDSSGNLYISDSYNGRIRKVLASTGVVTTIAGPGTGPLGDNGPATSATLNLPRGLTVDGMGNVFFADSRNGRVRRIDGQTGVITTAASASLGLVQDVKLDASGNLLIVDSSNQRIVKVAASTGVASTVAGGAYGIGGDGGPATSAQFNYPNSLAVDSAGNLYINDQGNERVRLVKASTGIITTIAGNGPAGDDGSATAAQFYQPVALAVDSQGNVFVGDASRIRKISASSGIVTDYAGYTVPGALGDNGPATSAGLTFPTAIAFDPSGNLYVAQYNSVRKVNASTGIITTVAGGTSGYNGDGLPASQTRFSDIQGLAFDRAGNLYIADANNQSIRKVDAISGIVTTVAGVPPSSFTGGGFGGDGGPANVAQLNYPRSVAVDSNGNIFIADSLNYRIRRVDGTTGIITTLTGTGTAGFSGDGGPASMAQIGYPLAIAVDSTGQVFFSDATNRIRKITTGGIISTVAGSGSFGFSGDGGPATSAQISNVSAIAPGPGGLVYFTDTANNRVRLLSGSIVGVVDTPADNSSVAGAVSFTGWAISPARVTSVALYRDPLPGEPAGANGLVFVGPTALVPGARPDIAAAFPGYPNNNYGWGAQVLTNELPNTTGSGVLGNGTYRIHAIATDASGGTLDIGARTITANNSGSKLPFGTIDTPAQGQTISGSAYVNFGWALTPQPNLIPFNGSTITVFIDNQPVGHPSYGFDRIDISTLFPGLQNTHNGVGNFIIDTTKLSNGLHTIAWVVSDNAGNAQGIGSRFFNVQN